MIKITAYSSDLEMWFFDDPTLGIKNEAFVDGADQLLTDFIKSLGRHRECDGIYRIAFEFSAEPLWFHSVVLEKTNKKSGFGDGFTVYQVVLTDRVTTNVDFVGLCPTLLKYYDEAPDKLFIRILS
jgi:hypothetical protein